METLEQKHTAPLRLHIVHDNECRAAEDIIGEHEGAVLGTVHSHYAIGQSFDGTEALAEALMENMSEDQCRAALLAAWQIAEGDDRLQLRGYIEDYLGDHESVLSACSDLGIVQAAIVDVFPYAILPVFMYAHGGATINTEGFHCPWDSGQIGFIWAESAAWTEEQLRSIVSCYDHLLRGNTWGFVTEEYVDGDWQHVDSCFGFLGDIEDCGIREHLDSDYLPLFDDAAENPEY